MKMLLPPEDDCIFLDIETAVDGGNIWLIGVVFQQQFDYFYAKSWDEEREMMLGFHEYLLAHPSKALIYYSRTNFDIRMIWNAAKRLKLYHMLNSLSNRPWIDYCIILGRSYDSPIRSYALKPLATHLGYMFMHGSLDGLEVATRYTNLVKKLGKVAEFEVQDLIEYNEDDVMSLIYLYRHFKDISKYTWNLGLPLSSIEIRGKINQLCVYQSIKENRISLSTSLENEEELYLVLMNLGLPIPQIKRGLNRVLFTWTNSLAIERLRRLFVTGK
ncbi:MAG: ribonuclease H-like domain-containing protein [Candidatus Heimdallarchaeota archaeon]|nr:ribonuclease H-like domain-containing protein [Candidatus Heimdallarchaeota archaeon]